MRPAFPPPPPLAPAAVFLLAMGAALAAPVDVSAQDPLAVGYHAKTSLNAPNAILVVDVVHTPEPELVLTDVVGNLRLLSSSTGGELLSIKLGETSLTAPVVGDFTGEGKLNIAVGTGDGRLILVSGTNPAVIAEAKLGQSFSVQPTVVTITRPDGAKYERLIVFDQNGMIRGVDFEAGGNVVQAWEYSTGASVQSPLVLGSVRRRDEPDVVATCTDGHVVLVNPITGQGEKVLIQEGTRINAAPLLMDADSDHLDEMVIALGGGELRCFKWDATAVPKAKLIWRAAVTSPPVAPPLLISRGSDISSFVLLHAAESSLQAIDPRTGQEIAVDRNVYNGINTQPAAIPRPNGYPELAFGLKKTFHVTTNLSEWIASRGTTPLKTRVGELSHNLSNTLVTFLPQTQGSAMVAGISPDAAAHLYVFDSGFSLSRSDWPTLTPWMTIGGSPMHASALSLGHQWTEREVAIRQLMLDRGAGWEAEVKTAMEQRNWDEASRLGALLVEFDPLNPEYTSLSWRIWRSRYLLQIVAVIGITLATLAFSAWQTARFLTNRRLRRRAESAVARGDYEEARRYYTRLFARQPRNRKVSLALARVCMAQRDFSEETLDIYRKAHAAIPDDRDILHSFARGLLLEPKTTPEAADVYRRTLETFPEPASLEYALGRCLLAEKQYEEAGKRFRAALRGGVATEQLYHSLCEVYLRTRHFTAKALPVFQQQYPSRREDREFLEAYLAVCIDAKKMDQTVEALCHEVLDLSPNHIPAYLQMARAMVQRSQPGPAIAEVRSALKLAPGDPDAILLLSHCYRVQSRKDPEALAAYRDALNVDASDGETLRVVAAIYFEREQFDAEAVSIYRRSLEQNPGDATTLRALAQTALLTADHALTVSTVEALAQQGQIPAKLTEQLAAAYIRLRIVEPRTERVLRDALRTSPEDAEFKAALARVLVAQDKDDLDSQPVYEAHLALHPNDVAVGRQLAKCYIKANRYENALHIAQRFLALAPEDEELQRLNAHASLYGNKIDEAVAEYQRMLAKNPGDKQALVNLALAYSQKLRTDDEARSYYERALAIQPADDSLLMALARCHAARNDAVNAVDCYKKALKGVEGNEQKVIANMMSLLSERPEILRLRWFLVEILVSYGHLREALDQADYIGKNHQGQTANILRALETVLQKDPNNVAALLQRGALLVISGETDKAIQVLEKVCQLQPSNTEAQDRLVRAYNDSLEKKDVPETRFRLGRLFYAQQEYDAAIGCFQKTSQDYRWEAESTKMLGKCFTGKGMLDLALQEFKKLVVDAETKELLYDLAQRYETKKDLVGAKTVYRQLFAADIDYKDVKTRFEMLSGSTSDPMAFEKTSIVQQMSEEAARRYELLDELGRGAMGIVYRARDKELEEIVALKILPDNMSNNPEAVRRFKIEARNARKLSHPNIVRIHDIGEEMGRKYISMEYVDGSDLKKTIKTSPDMRMPVDSAVKYAMQIADALGYAHRLGIVHRDIKPANIMLTSTDEVKVTDFGIAKMMDSTGEGTMIGAVIGTPLYMSPEQVQGIPVDNRADIYAYGIMLYEFFNGRPPFTEGDLAYQHMNREPTPIEGLPRPLWDIVAKCLAKKKEDRWDKSELVYDALRDYRRTMG